MEVLIILFIVAFIWRIMFGDNGSDITITPKRRTMETFVFTHKTDKKAAPVNISATNIESARAKLGEKSANYEYVPPKVTHQ